MGIDATPDPCPLSSSSHGHFGPVEWEGETVIMYHYHLNREYPFSVGCFRGNVDYYRALGSVQMRETNLPLYTKSPLAAKLKNKRAEIDAVAAVGGNKTASAVAGVDAWFDAAAAKAEAVDVAT